MDTTTVTAAQPIRPYRAPQLLIEPTGAPADADELEAVNACEIERHDNLTGWGDYTHVVAATDDTGETRWYIATLEG